MEETRYMYHLSRRTRIVAYGILLTVNAIHKKYSEIWAVKLLIFCAISAPTS